MKEIRCGVQILLFAGHPVKLYQRKFNLLMSGITFFLSFAGTEYSADQIRIFPGDVKNLRLPGGLIVSNRCFYHVSCRVKLVSFHQVRPLFVWLVDCVVGVQVSIGLLRPSYQFDHFICQCFVFSALPPGNTECYGFQPFIQVRVLENYPLSLSRQLPRCHAEILNTVGRFGVLQLIVQDLPLMRNDLLTDLLHVFTEQLVCDPDISVFQLLPVMSHTFLLSLFVPKVNRLIFCEKRNSHLAVILLYSSFL